MAREQKLRPLMREDQLQSFFESRLPNDLSGESFERGFSCLGFARLIIDYCGGPSEARIFFISKFDPALDARVGHAYVAPAHFPDNKLALNNYYPNFGLHTVGFLRRNGRDITDMVLGVPWANLVFRKILSD